MKIVKATLLNHTLIKLHELKIYVHNYSIMPSI